MDELNGERIDVIQWAEKVPDYIKASLSPAKTSVIVLDEGPKRAKIYVQPDQRPLAIGKQGQNVRLASILVGWELDILDVADYEGTKKSEEKLEVKEVKIEDLDVDKELIEKLSAANLTLVEQIKGLNANDLSEVDGIDQEGAESIEKAVKKYK